MPFIIQKRASSNVTTLKNTPNTLNRCHCLPDADRHCLPWPHPRQNPYSATPCSTPTPSPRSSQTPNLPPPRPSPPRDSSSPHPTYAPTPSISTIATTNSDPPPRPVPSPLHKHPP